MMKKDARYSVKNPKVTAEDIADHQAVAAVFHENNEILVLWHDKYHYFTLPVGKVKPGQSLQEALLEEVKEEVGVNLVEFRQILTFEEDYDRGDGVVTHTDQHIFDVVSYTETIRNAEPGKHAFIAYITPREASALTEKSDVLTAYLKYVNDNEK